MVFLNSKSCRRKSHCSSNAFITDRKRNYLEYEQSYSGFILYTSSLWLPFVVKPRPTGKIWRSEEQSRNSKMSLEWLLVGVVIVCKKTESKIIARALIVLSNEIQSPDDIPMLALREAAERILELDKLTKRQANAFEEQAEALGEFTNPKNWTRGYKFDGQLSSKFALYKHGDCCQRRVNLEVKEDGL